MSESIRLVIPEASPSLNKYAFRHWRVQHGDKKRWGQMLAVAALGARAPKAIGKRRLTVERHGRRKLDVDNFAGGLKPIIDGLKKLQLIVDDDDAHLELALKQERIIGAQRPHTVLILEDVRV